MRVPLVLCGGLLLCGEAVHTLDARSPASLVIILTTDQRLTPAGRAALIGEATRIWENGGVRLEWASPLVPQSTSVDTLRMLAVARPAIQVRTNPAVLGELHRVSQSRALALISLDEAERIAARGERWRHTPLREHHIGIILGRAAAHEIGHYLLNTSTHAERGLMRARFDEIEFADPRSVAFDLDDSHRAWVQRRLAEGLPLGPAASNSQPFID